MSESMKGKIVMVTGANSGIGKATSIGLAELGATIVMVCRDRERGENAAKEIKEISKNSNVDLMIADLSNQEDIRNLVKEFKSKYQQLHVLINNAGVMISKRRETADGFEMQFAVNHLAPFLLTNLLLDVLKVSTPARIVNVSSGLHSWGKIDFDDLQSKKEYGRFRTYGTSKLELNLITFELARRLEGTGVTANVVHPGMVRSNLGRDMNWLARNIFKLMTKSPKSGAKTSIYVASSPDLEGVTGKYFAKSKEKQASDDSYDEALAKKMWEVSAELTKLST